MPAPFVNEYSRERRDFKWASVSVCQHKSSLLAVISCLLTILVLRAEPVHAGDYERIAADLSKAARRHGKSRVAVLPFKNIGKHDALAGTFVSERLVAYLMAHDELELVERAMLASIMREQRLEHSGAVDPGSIKELGKVLGVDALVLGSVLELRDGRFEVNARIIDTQTARVLGASLVKVDKEWETSILDDVGLGDMSLPPLPRFELASTLHAAEPRDDCGRAAETIDEMDRSVLDMKARYWAARLKDRDFSRAGLKRNPGSEIRNPLTRRQFYERLRLRYDEGASRPTAAEVRAMEESDHEAERLAEQCRLNG